MKYRWDKKYLYWGFTAFLVIVASILFYYLIFHSVNLKTNLHAVINISMPIIDGLVLAYLLTPIVNFLEKKMLIPLCFRFWGEVNKKRKKYIRFVSIILTMFLFLGSVYGFLAMVMPHIITSIEQIGNLFPYYANNLEALARKILENNADLEKVITQIMDQYSNELNNWLNNKLVPMINNQLSTLVKQVSMSLLAFIKVLWDLVIGFIVSIYILGSKETFTAQGKKILYALLEEKRANGFIEDMRFVNTTFGRYISGKLLDSLMVGIICYMGMKMMDLPYAELISVIVGITNIIPYFGPYIGAIPSTILILMVDPKQALYFVIFILILQQIDGNILEPKILGDSTGLSGFWVIFSITIFGGLFGVLGMILGVPLFAVLYALVGRRFQKMLLRKNMPAETEKYLNLDRVEEKTMIEIPEENTGDKSKKQKKQKDLKNEDQKTEDQKTEDINETSEQKNEKDDIK